MVVKYGNRSPDISISEPVVDESDSVLQSTPAPSSTEDAGSRDEKATGWKLISAEKQLFRVPAEEVSRSCGGIRDSSSEPQGRRSRGRHQTAGRQRRRLRSARLCSPAARTVGGKKGELQLAEMRRVEKSYIIGGRRLWSAGPCSPATSRPGGDRKNQSADLFGPNIRMTGGYSYSGCAAPSLTRYFK